MMSSPVPYPNFVDLIQTLLIGTDVEICLHLEQIINIGIIARR